MFFYESSAYEKWCEKVYGKALNQSGMLTYKELQLMFKYIKLNPNSLILDVGCGLGGITNEIAENYLSKVIGIDIDENMINYAKKIYHNRTDLEFNLTDATYIQNETNKYDLICLIDTIYFSSTSDLVFQFLDNCLKALKPDGKIAIFSSYVPDNSLNISPLDYNAEIKKWSNSKSIDVESICLSEDFRFFWPNAFNVCLELSSIMKNEIPEAYEKLLLKCSAFSDLCRMQSQDISRWLNIITR